MGARGPKPGFKKARQVAQEQVQQAPAVAPVSDVVCDPAAVHAMPAAYRENPEKLGGAALKELAHKRGLSRTECERLPDVKLREQLRYLAYRQYDR